MNLNTVPSVFQICYGGCKGMIALDPSLGENREILVIRHSMKKFESSSKSLEVLQVSRPGKFSARRIETVTLNIKTTSETNLPNRVKVEATAIPHDQSNFY